MAQPKYEIIERIGAGGMAEVFKASSTSLKGFQKLVAIKRVLPNLTENERFVRMFLDEAKVALPLNHTNIVQTFDLGIADETYFIVMEFVDGTDLKEIIQELNDRRADFSIPEVAHVGIAICKGLAHAHDKTDPEGNDLDIVHRDISPPNILLSRDGEIKITDFGLAKAKSQAELTDPGVVKGKFGYLSPEAAQGEDIDERTDIFAVGIVLWEMLTGKRLFLGDSDYDTLKLVRKAEIPRLAEAGRQVPQEFERIIRKALARDLDARFQSARALGSALAEFLYGYGEAVTSFDLIPYAEAVLGDKKPIGERELAPADRAVQQEINEFVSVEDLEDLDKRLANQEDIGQKVDVEPRETGDFEDPRAWDDVGVSSDEIELDDDSVPDGSVDESDEWKEQELSDVAKATQSFEAIDESDRDDYDGGDGDGPSSGGGPPGAGGQNQTAPGGQSADAQGLQARQKDGGRQQPPRQHQQQAAGGEQPARRGSGDGGGRNPRGAGEPSAAPTAPQEPEESAGGSALPVVALLLAILAVVAAGAYYWLEVA